MGKLREIGHRESFKIRTHEIDINRKIKIPSLLQLMQEASMSNAIQLNVSIWDLEDKALSWVLVKKVINITTLPKLGDQIDIITYPSGFEKLFAFRDFIVKDSGGNVCVEASSAWILMNIETRKLVKPEFTIASPTDVKCLERPNFNIPKINSQKDGKEFRINWFDLDWNNHVNNVFLLKCTLESLPENILSSKQIEKISIQFKSEGLLNDVLISNCKHTDAQKTLVYIFRKSDQKIIAQSEIVFK